MSDDPVERAWSALLEQWDDPGRHKAFVVLAQTLDRLPDAARHYRELRDDPERGDAARKGLDAVLSAAMVMLSPMERAPSPPRGIWLVPLVFAGLLAMATVTVSKVMHLPRLGSPVVLLGEAVMVFLLPWPRLLGAKREG